MPRRSFATYTAVIPAKRTVANHHIPTVTVSNHKYNAGTGSNNTGESKFSDHGAEFIYTPVHSLGASVWKIKRIVFYLDYLVQKKSELII